MSDVVESKRTQAFVLDFLVAGIDILRYSGSEIMKDPISCAGDLFQYIESHWEFEHFLKRADA